MKNMFKILFFALLFQASPLFAQETDVLYKFKTSSDNLWKTFGDVKVQPIYKGEIKNGMPNGRGVYTYPDGERYVGQFKNGIQDGQGTLSYPDGRKYVGEFKNGIQNGQGTNTFSNGWNGVGEWIDVEPWNIQVFDKKGDLKMKGENGKVQYF